MKKKAKYNVAVVGVGAVGVEMLRVLRERNFPVDQLRVFARSARTVNVDNYEYKVEEVSAEAFNNVDIALFAGTEGEKGAAVTFAPEAVKRGAVVIDNGADFRMQDDVPLVVPEVNAADVKKHKGIIANPNCSTIQMVAALAPIYKYAGIKRVVATTFQAVSGAGRSAIKQLWEESKQITSEFDMAKTAQKPMVKKSADAAFDHQIAFNAIPQIGGFAECDYTSEEWKMVHETHKIMHDKKIKVSATCVRVPVLNAHSETVYLETNKEVEVSKVRALLKKAPGIVLIDDPKNKQYPMPAGCSSRDEVFVGRIRKDPYVKNGLWLWIVSDNLRKGAATNAVQIAECLIGKKLK